MFTSSPRCSRSISGRLCRLWKRAKWYLFHLTLKLLCRWPLMNASRTLISSSYCIFVRIKYTYTQSSPDIYSSRSFQVRFAINVNDVNNEWKKKQGTWSTALWGCRYVISSLSEREYTTEAGMSDLTGWVELNLNSYRFSRFIWTPFSLISQQV